LKPAIVSYSTLATADVIEAQHEIDYCIPSSAMEHTHKNFDLELSDLRAKLAQMGDLVIAQIENALACLSDHDVRGTRMIIEQDSNVNRMDIDLEEMCVQFLALHQPVAGDLRRITSAMKISTELERIGDRVVNICEAVHDRDEPTLITSHAEVSKMAALALAMVRDSTAAFSRMDSSHAQRVFEQDKELMRSTARRSRSSPHRWRKIPIASGTTPNWPSSQRT
jgi:phosphate transport system regulatory protein PhoU